MRAPNAIDMLGRAANGRIETGEALRRIAAEDISGEGPNRPCAIVRPPDIDALQAVVRTAASQAMPIVVRGGGLSYTGGYWAMRPDTVMIDMTAIDTIGPVDRDEMTVTVEAGATWAAVREALTPLGLRLPVFGPLSGARATVGGGIAQNTAFYGSASHGLAGDHVTGLDVVTGNGELLTVGGTDVAAYVGDAGVLGIKARIRMRLVKEPRRQRYASFAFDGPDEVLAVQRAIASGTLGGRISEAYAFDRVTHENLAATGFSVLEAAGIAGDVARGAGTLVGAARSLTRLAVSPRARLTELAWSLHCVLEGDDPAGLEDAAAALGDLCARDGGRAIPDTIPRVTRAKPFRLVKAMLGPNGERWLPMHGLFAPADAAAALGVVETVRERHRTAMDRHDVRLSTMMAVVGERIIVEPQLFWPDALTAFLRANVLPQQLASHGTAAANPEGRALATLMRQELTKAFADVGSRFIQLGKYYKVPLSEAVFSDQKRLKALNDPAGIINPGGLGFG